ncbi:MAG TPA: hypothetical protein VJ739_11815 [Gemmataceae bacterium]|nr:hypothetical protein [Gemmataceae bacterium]
MTLYHVHLYREMRLYFPGIEAETAAEAARIAADRPTEDAAYVEGCDGENLGALIDVAGDNQYEHSVTLDFEAERLRKAARELLGALEEIYRWLTPDWQHSPLGKKAHAAIAKATAHDAGGSQP